MSTKRVRVYVPPKRPPAPKPLSIWTTRAHHSLTFLNRLESKFAANQLRTAATL